MAPIETMDVIPAIDLQGGLVVRAQKGMRHSYAPIVTPLARTSKPLDVVSGLLAIHPFKAVYVADLDRIELRGSNERRLEELRAAFPELEFWVDPGIRCTAEAKAWLARHRNPHLVLGSETLESASVLKELGSLERILLSLDYRGGIFLGPAEIRNRPELWPRRVIVMTLSHIGANSGPDLDRLIQIKCSAPRAEIYAAGGLRDAGDLSCLNQRGVSGVLVASALHDGALSGADLAALEAEGERREKGAGAPFD